MNLKLETKADYVEAITALANRITALEQSRGGFFKPDIIGNLPKGMAEALKRARTEFLPLQKSGTAKKDGKTFSTLDDYIEATSNAFRKNGLTLSFSEENEPAAILMAFLIFENERYEINTPVKLANMDDPKKALMYGFKNARSSVYKTLGGPLLK